MELQNIQGDFLESYFTVGRKDSRSPGDREAVGLVIMGAGVVSG